MFPNSQGFAQCKMSKANKISVLLDFGVKQKPPTDKIPFINKIGS